MGARDSALHGHEISFFWQASEYPPHPPAGTSPSVGAGPARAGPAERAAGREPPSPPKGRGQSVY
jgi:hypothetical protein